MTTVINNPGNGENSDSGVAMIVGVIVLVVVVGLFFVYVLPMIRDNNSSQESIDVNVKLPASNNSGTSQ